MKYLENDLRFSALIEMYRSIEKKIRLIEKMVDLLKGYSVLCAQKQSKNRYTNNLVCLYTYIHFLPVGRSFLAKVVLSHFSLCTDSDWSAKKRNHRLSQTAILSSSFIFVFCSLIRRRHSFRIPSFFYRKFSSFDELI